MHKHMIHQRTTTPASIRYGTRWKSLPVERERPRDRFTAWFGTIIGLATLLYMLAMLAVR